MGLVLAVAACGVAVNFKPQMLCIAYKITKGAVSEKHPNDHLGISYTYEVDGHLYTGASYAGQLNRVFDEIRLGDLVTVFYDEHRPSNSTVEVPSVLLVQRIGTIIAACAILPALGLYFLRHRQPFSNRENLNRSK